MDIETLKGCIDDCQKDLRSIHDTVRDLRHLHAIEFGNIDKRLSVLESVVVGNGRPGLIDLIDKQACVMQGVNGRLSEIENRNNFVESHRALRFKRIGVAVAVGGLLFTILYNLYSLLTGG